MIKNEINMLEKWAGYLESGDSAGKAIAKLSAEMPEYKPGFDSLLKQEYPEEGIFQDYTIMLTKIGDFLDSDRGTKHLIETIKEAKEAAELEYVRNPGEERLNEIVACYSFGKLIFEGMPMIETVNMIRGNFEDFNGDSFKYAKAERFMHYLHESLARGSTLAEPMHKKRFFSPESIYLAEIGESCGNVGLVFKKATEILKDKIKYNLTPEQTGEIVFYYGLGLLENDGFAWIKSLRMLRDLSKSCSIGPSPEVLENMIQDFDAGANVKETFSKQNYFSQEFKNEIDENGFNLEIIAPQYAERLQERYRSWM